MYTHPSIIAPGTIICDGNAFRKCCNGTIALNPLRPPCPIHPHHFVGRPRLHVRFRLFLAIFIHSRDQIIPEQNPYRTRGHLKGKSRVHDEKYAVQQPGKVSIIFRHANVAKSSKTFGWTSRLIRFVARIVTFSLEIRFLPSLLRMSSGVVVDPFHFFRALWDRRRECLNVGRS